MSRRNRYELNYARIQALLRRPLVQLQPEDVIRLKTEGFMDLTCEVLLSCEQTGATVLSMCHYFEQNGDLCQDPEMTIRLFHPGSTADRVMTPSTGSNWGRADATTYQQSIPPIYRVVYPAPGRYRPGLRKELNAFLVQWLKNLKAQGHRPQNSDD